MNDTAHGQVWDLIPWYVNDTLDAKARATVATHAESCALCRAEIAAQERVAAILSEDTALEQSAWANWDGVAARLDAPAVTKSGPWTRLVDRLRSFHVSMPAAAVTAATAIAVLAVAGWQGPTMYRTLTTEPAAAVETELRFRARPGTDHGALLGDLEALGLTIVSGETADTLIRVLPPTDQAVRDAALKALLSDPRIAVIAGAEG